MGPTLFELILSAFFGKVPYLHSRNIVFCIFLVKMGIVGSLRRPVGGGFGEFTFGKRWVNGISVVARRRSAIRPFVSSFVRTATLLSLTARCPDPVGAFAPKPATEPSGVRKTSSRGASDGRRRRRLGVSWGAKLIDFNLPAAPRSSPRGSQRRSGEPYWKSS